MYIQAGVQDLHRKGITSIAELRPDEWKLLDVAQRMAVLQKCQDVIARVEGRSDETPQVRDFEHPDWGAVYYKTENQILINTEVLKNDDPYVAFGKLMHESHHAYIEYAMNHPGFHPGGEMTEWKEDYPNTSHDSPMYKWSTIERDCNNLEKSLSKELKDQHDHERDTGPQAHKDREREPEM